MCMLMTVEMFVVGIAGIGVGMGLEKAIGVLGRVDRAVKLRLVRRNAHVLKDGRREDKKKECFMDSKRDEYNAVLNGRHCQSTGELNCVGLQDAGASHEKDFCEDGICDVGMLKKAYESLQGEIVSLRRELKKREDQISSLEDDVRKAEEDLSMLRVKCSEAGRLEKTAPFLVYCIQAMLGYVKSGLLSSRPEDFSHCLREDIETLQAELERNGIEVVFDVAGADNGFDKVRDTHLRESERAVAAPMLLRNGVILRRGKILLPSAS